MLATRRSARLILTAWVVIACTFGSPVEDSDTLTVSRGSQVRRDTVSDGIMAQAQFRDSPAGRVIQNIVDQTLVEFLLQNPGEVGRKPLETFPTASQSNELFTVKVSYQVKDLNILTESNLQLLADGTQQYAQTFSDSVLVPANLSATPANTYEVFLSWIAQPDVVPLVARDGTPVPKTPKDIGNLSECGLIYDIVYTTAWVNLVEQWDESIRANRQGEGYYRMLAALAEHSTTVRSILIAQNLWPS